MVTCSFEILAGESTPEFMENSCPLPTPKGEPLTLTELKPLKVAERQIAVFEICLPKKVQNFTKFNGKELKWNKYEIITFDDGWAYTMIIKGVLSSDFKELSTETSDLVQKIPLFINHKYNPSWTLPCPGARVVSCKGVPNQFVSNLKNTQVKKKGKTSLECGLTFENASIKVPFKAKPVPKVIWFKGSIEVTEEEKVVSIISLGWQEPDQGDTLAGYILEVAEDTKKWTKCPKIHLSGTTYTVGSLQERHILLLNPSFCTLELHNKPMQHSFATTSSNREIPQNPRETAGSRQNSLVWNGNMQYCTEECEKSYKKQAVHKIARAFDLTVRLKSLMVVCAGTAPCSHASFPVRFCVVSYHRRNPATGISLGIW
ncbi:LOW QUALITY PROTEIN: immunoglobulin superfamily member 22 [Porphyrio hochstetteri]